MNILLIGSGGREHALAYKLSESKSLTKLFISPGNPGTSLLGQNIDAGKSNNDIIKFCKDENIDLVVVGPEIPLVDGIEDALTTAGFPVFGPSKNAARIEGDKVFSKNLMRKYNIPTAGYEVFGNGEKEKAVEYVKNGKFPVVIKASGLAAGKGVLICNNAQEALEAIETCMVDKKFGDSGDNIVIEEFMEGEEASIFALTDGEDYYILPAAQDHKRIYDNDEGPNTGGMGAYAPAPVITNELLSRVEKEIIKPVLAAMEKEDSKYKGCLYCGLMITNEGPKVVEFNCRFGDPETQAVLPLLDGDFVKLLYSCAVGEIDHDAVKVKSGNCVCVIAASEGYPEGYEKGHEITGIDNISDKDIIVFHAGTKQDGDKIITSGGRVLGVSAVKETASLAETKEAAYNAMSKINFKGIYYRKDIADKAIK